MNQKRKMTLMVYVSTVLVTGLLLRGDRHRHSKRDRTILWVPFEEVHHYISMQEASNSVAGGRIQR